MSPDKQLVLRNPEDFYTVPCWGCGRSMEFFCDDPLQHCPACGTLRSNPRLVGEHQHETVALSG